MKKLNFKYIIAILLGVILVSFLYMQVYVSNQGLQLINESPKKIVYLEENTDCDLLKSRCEYVIDNKTVMLEFSGSVQTMKRFTLIAQLKNFRSNVNEVSVKFSMKSMNMGQNNFQLLPANYNVQNSDRWKTSLLLPICTSKRTDWEMTVSVMTKNTTYVKTILLDIR